MLWNHYGCLCHTMSELKINKSPLNNYNLYFYMYFHQQKKVITRKYYIEVVHKNFRLHGTLSKIDFCFFGILGWLLTAILHIVHLLMIITVFIHHKKETAHQYAQFFFGWPTWYMVGENRSLAISFVMLCDWCNANI